MSTNKEIREFQRRQKAITCPQGHRNWFAYADLMGKDRLLCEHCGERVPFDKEKWRAQNFKPPPESVDEKINKRGASQAKKKAPTT